MTSRTNIVSDDAADAMAVRRALTGIRDRLRLQEDELDRLREAFYSEAPQDRPELAVIANQVEQLRGEMDARLASLEKRLTEQGKILQEGFSVIGRTNTNLRRLMVQVDRLLEELCREKPRFEVAAESSFRWRVPVATVVVLAAILAVIWWFYLRDGAKLIG